MIMVEGGGAPGAVDFLFCWVVMRGRNDDDNVENMVMLMTMMMTIMMDIDDDDADRLWYRRMSIPIESMESFDCGCCLLWLMALPLPFIVFCYLSFCFLLSFLFVAVVCSCF